ncbi:MAG TPA: hypothetical protein VFG03_03970, partial [Telluria sp.]|nr:hypothetical protein [Telluria sp.]
REGRTPRKAYAKKPVRCGSNTVELYAKYQREQTENSQASAVANAKARDHKSRLIESAKLRGRLKRTTIKLMDAPRIAKKWMYKATGKTLVGEIAAINKAYLKERQANYDKHRRMAWADWLRVQATDGDKDALDALRARDACRATKGNAFSGDLNPLVRPMLQGRTESPRRVPSSTAAARLPCVMTAKASRCLEARIRTACALRWRSRRSGSDHESQCVDRTPSGNRSPLLQRAKSVTSPLMTSRWNCDAGLSSAKVMSKRVPKRIVSATLLA